jgi:hypothetical protein
MFQRDSDNSNYIQAQRKLDSAIVFGEEQITHILQQMESFCNADLYVGFYRRDSDHMEIEIVI